MSPAEQHQEHVPSGNDQFEVLDARVCTEFLDRSNPCGPLGTVKSRHWLHWKRRLRVTARTF